ncbi:MAG: ATP-binding protein [Candidatus Saccharicenans sp.]
MKRGARFYIFLALVLILILLGFFNISRKLSWKEPYDGVTWADSPSGLIAVRVEEDSPAYLSGIKPGDILFFINNTPIKNRLEYTRMLWLLDRLQQKALYQLGRGGAILSPSFYLTKKGVSSSYIFLMLLGLSSLALSLIVFVNSTRQITGSYTLFYLVSFALYSIFVFSPTGQMDFFDQLFFWLDKVALLVFPPLLLTFFVIFPQKKNFAHKKWLLSLTYLPALILFLMNLFTVLVLANRLNEADYISWHKLLEKAELSHFGLFSLVIIFLSIKETVQTKNLFLKNQLKWILGGLGLGLIPFILFYIMPFLLDHYPSRFGQLSVLFQALVPLTIAYSITRYRLMDFELLAKKGATLIISFLIIALVYFLVSSQTKIFSENRLNAILLGLLAIILGATLFTPISEMIQALVDRVLYRRSYQYRRTLLMIANELNRERNLDRLSQYLVETIAKAMMVEMVAIYLARDEQNREFYLLKSLGEPDGRVPVLKLGEEEVSRLLKADYLTKYISSEGVPEKSSLANLMDCGFSNIIPLRLENKIIGLFALSNKMEDVPLSAEDLELLRTIAPSVALALENAYLYNQEIIRAQELQRLKDYSDNIIESLTVGVAVIDQTGKVTGWNRVLERQFGLAREFALHKHLSEVIGPENFQALFASDPQIEYQMINEVTLTTATGEKRIFDVARTPLLDNQLQAYGTIIVFEDITDKVKLQQQLLTSEKLASLGLLSAGIAHEINTPLTGISSYVQMLQKKLTDAHYAQILQKIEAQTERVSRIIKNLLNFARNPADESFHRLDLKESLEEIISLIDYRLKSLNIKLELKLQPVFLYAQRERLQQVFINIILNALDAMPHGGTLTIETYKSDSYAVVKITDTGTGIKPEHLPRIFDPFFTTKGLGKGTGLGLSISFAIIKEHDGQILVDTAVGRGTTFTIMIPDYLVEKQRQKIGKQRGET